MSTTARAKRAVNGVRVWLWADDAEGEFQALLSEPMARELLAQLAAALERPEAPLPRHDPRPALPGAWNAPEGPAWGTPDVLPRCCNGGGDRGPADHESWCRNRVAPSSEVPKEEPAPRRPYFTTFYEHARLE